MPTPGAPRTVRSFNFGAITCAIGPVALSNYGADGEIEFDYPSDIMTSELSADGFVTYSVEMDQRVSVTIRLMETSRALPLLQAMVDTQVARIWAGNQLPEYPFIMACPSTGDLIGGRIVFLKEPVMSKQKQAGTREFSLEMPYGRFRQIFGGVNGALSDVYNNLRNVLNEQFE